jgi:hypothetical protein
VKKAQKNVLLIILTLLMLVVLVLQVRRAYRQGQQDGARERNRGAAQPSR